MKTRRRQTRAAAVLIAVAAPLLAACGSSSTGGASPNASCAAPYLDDQPPGGRNDAPAATADAGQTLTIYGHWYTSTCNDTGGHDPLEPLDPVHLTVTFPGGRTVPLGEFAPKGTDMGFSADVDVPPGTPAGTATVRDDQEGPGTYRFTVVATP